MSPYTFILTAYMVVTYPHGGQLTRNIHEEFHAPENPIPCEIFKIQRGQEFLKEESTPLLMKGLEVTMRMDLTCVEGEKAG